MSTLYPVIYESHPSLKQDFLNKCITVRIFLRLKEKTFLGDYIAGWKKT